MDTSVWITLLRYSQPRGLSPGELLDFVTCGPVLQEVFQGLRQDRLSSAFCEDFLAIPRLCDPVPLSAYLQAAEIYREGRRKGFTIRSSTNCLIAAIAMENSVPVWHRDRDFKAIANFTSLRAIEKLEPQRVQ